MCLQYFDGKQISIHVLTWDVVQEQSNMEYPMVLAPTKNMYQHNKYVHCENMQESALVIPPKCLYTFAYCFNTILLWTNTCTKMYKNCLSAATCTLSLLEAFSFFSFNSCLCSFSALRGKHRNIHVQFDNEFDKMLSICIIMKIHLPAKISVQSFTH